MNPAAVAPNAAASGTHARKLLKLLVSDSAPLYTDSAPAPADSAGFASVLGRNQINDLQLIEIARANNCILPTADQGLIRHFSNNIEPLRLS